MRRADVTQIKGPKGPGIALPVSQPKWNDAKDEMTFMLVAPDTPELEMKLNVASYITFRDVSLLETLPAQRLLRYWIERVAHAIDTLDGISTALLNGGVIVTYHG